MGVAKTKSQYQRNPHLRTDSSLSHSGRGGGLNVDAQKLKARMDAS